MKNFKRGVEKCKRGVEKFKQVMKKCKRLDSSGLDWNCRHIVGPGLGLFVTDCNNPGWPKYLLLLACVVELKLYMAIPRLQSDIGLWVYYLNSVPTTKKKRKKYTFPHCQVPGKSKTARHMAFFVGTQGYGHYSTQLIANRDFGNDDLH